MPWFLFGLALTGLSLSGAAIYSLRIARERGKNVRVIELGLGVAANPLYAEDVVGGVKFVVDEDTKTLVGVTFVGPNAGEQIHAATIAIVVGFFLVFAAGFAHPEALHNAVHDARHSLAFPCH